MEKINNTFSQVLFSVTPSESLRLMCKQHLKPNGKYFQFKGPF